MSYNRQARTLKFATFLVISACYLVIAASIVLGVNFKRVLSQWGEDVQMTVYLSPDVSAENKAAIEGKMASISAIDEFVFISQDRALDDFRDQLAHYAPDITKDEDLLTLIPASYNLKLQSNIAISEQGEVLKKIEDEVGALAGVDEVSYGQDWIEKYSSLIRMVDLVFYALIAIVVFASLFVISNSIRASIASRREEIVVLEMVGATFSSIRRPFLVEGAVTGFMAAALAVAMSSLGVYLFKAQASGALGFLRLNETVQFLPLYAVALLIIGGTAIGTLASFLCIRSVNDGYAGARA